jgi:cyanate lyase
MLQILDHADRRDEMNAADVAEKLLSAKRQKGLNFADLGKTIGRDEVWIAALFYRQAQASQDEARKLAAALGVGPELAEALTEFPLKGLGPVVPTDPLIYRFYEIMQVYGMPMKAVIHEKFGDGIMSAIDFTLEVDKEQDPKGDRVRVTMSGKFLPYKKW